MGEEWKNRQQGEGRKTRVEDKKESGEGQGRYIYQGEAGGPLHHRQQTGGADGKDPRIGAPIIIAREERNRGRDQWREIAGGKQNQKRRPGKGPHKGLVKSVERMAEENIYGRGTSKTPEMAEGEGVSNQP